jgi:hypothetical protein
MIVLKKLNDIEHEKELLVVKLSYLHILVDSLRYENCVLNEKIKSIENNLDMPRNYASCH